MLVSSGEQRNERREKNAARAVRQEVDLETMTGTIALLGIELGEQVRDEGHDECGGCGQDDQGGSNQRGAAPHGEAREPVEEQRHLGCRRGRWVGTMGVAEERRQILRGQVA